MALTAAGGMLTAPGGAALAGAQQLPGSLGAQRARAAEERVLWGRQYLAGSPGGSLSRCCQSACTCPAPHLPPAGDDIVIGKTSPIPDDGSGMPQRYSKKVGVPQMLPVLLSQ